MYTLNNNLQKIRDLLHLSQNSSVSKAIDAIKPPIFWKEKPNILSQTKKWNIKKIKEALQKTYEIEVTSKSSSEINKNILIKKLMLDICLLANS